MAEFYCDHGAYGASNRLAMDVPAWGVPQEGDGLAVAASTAASTAAIVLNGQPTAGQVISICGVTLTAAASGNGTTSFTIGASLDATANNIASVMNACTSTVPSAVANGVPSLKNLVYARGPSGGAPAATVQIMMRVGSSTLNAHASNQITTNFGTAPTITQWNGGASGCFGYLINEPTYNVASATAYATYGALIGKFYHAGAVPASSDTIYVRTGTNRTITLNPSTGHITFSRESGFAARIVFDTNTKWTGDAADGVLTLVGNITSTWQLSWTPVVTFSQLQVMYKCLGRGGFKLKTIGTGTGQFLLYGFRSGTHVHIEGFAFEDATTGVARLSPFASDATSNPGIGNYVNCAYERSVAQATLPALFTLMPSGNMARAKFDGCSFTYNISGTSDPGALFAYATANASSQVNYAHFINCRFVANGYTGGLTMFPAGVPSWATGVAQFYELRFENCTGLRMPTAFAGLLTSTFAVDPDAHSLYLNLGNDGFRHENCRGVSDWLPTETVPTLGAKLPDGVTSWSMRLVWTALGILSPITPYSAPVMRVYNRLATASRTIGLEFAAPNALTLSGDMLRLVVSYTDSSGTPRVESTQAVAASAASWSNATGYTAYKIELATEQAVASNTEITVRLDLVAAPSTGSNANLYVNPEPSIA